jgi:hypothetical protein
MSDHWLASDNRVKPGVWRVVCTCGKVVRGTDLIDCDRKLAVHLIAEYNTEQRGA